MAPVHAPPKQEWPQVPQFNASVLVLVHVVAPPAAPIPPVPVPPAPAWELVPPVPDVPPVDTDPPVPGVPPVASDPPVPVDEMPPAPPCAPEPPPVADFPPAPPGLPVAPPGPPPAPPRPPIAPAAPVVPAPPSVPELPPSPPSTGMVRVGQAADVKVRGRNSRNATSRRFVMARPLSAGRSGRCGPIGTQRTHQQDLRFSRAVLGGHLQPAKDHGDLIHSMKYTSSIQRSVMRGGPASGVTFLWACQLTP
jgi:hypothetical protein